MTPRIRNVINTWRKIYSKADYILLIVRTLFLTCTGLISDSTSRSCYKSESGCSSGLCSGFTVDIAPEVWKYKRNQGDTKTTLDTNASVHELNTWVNLMFLFYFRWVYNSPRSLTALEATTICGHLFVQHSTSDLLFTVIIYNFRTQLQIDNYICTSVIVWSINDIMFFLFYVTVHRLPNWYTMTGMRVSSRLPQYSCKGK